MKNIRCYLYTISSVTNFRLLFTIILPLITFNSIIAQNVNGSLTNENKKLAEQVNNPTSPLTQIQLRNVFSTRIPGYDGGSNLFQIIPVLPIPRGNPFGFDQLMKVTIQIPSTPNPNAEAGFGDLELFDLAAFKKPWGQWGAGLTFVFPTASSEILGQGKWQIGPAIAIMYTKFPDLILGAVFQNQISFAGDPSREDVNALIITPTITMNFADGWFAGYSDFNWTVNWRNDAEVTIPIGLQCGKVVSLGSAPLSVSMEACWTAIRPDNFPEWLVGFECILIFPDFIK